GSAQGEPNQRKPTPPSRSTEKSWPHFRPLAVDFCMIFRYFSLRNEETETRASVSNAATNAQDRAPEYSCNPVLLSIKSPIHAAFASRRSRRLRRRNFAKARCRAGACNDTRRIYRR